MVRLFTVFCAVAALGLAVVPVHADGVRGVTVGESCDKAAILEPALGSSRVNSNDTASVMHFTGTYSGQAADIVYLCDGGRLVEQIITIGADDRDHAFRVAEEIRLAAVREFGTPAHDGLGLNYMQKLWYSLWGIDGDVMLQSTIWDIDKNEVFLWVTHGADNGWDVRYSQSAAATMIVNQYAGIR